MVFESRSLGVEVSDGKEIDPIAMQDWINLILVVVPISIVVLALINGFSPAGSAMLALTVLLFLSFLNPDMRKEPIRVAMSFAQGGRDLRAVAYGDRHCQHDHCRTWCHRAPS